MLIAIRIAIKIVLTILIASFCIIAIILFNYFFITWSTSNQIYKSSKNIADYQHVLILGAGNSPLGEWQNKVFSSRMNTAVQLYHEINIDRIVCSGIIKPPFYNEPFDMTDFLVNKNIPKSIIVPDSNGINTLRSISSYTQKYHNDSVIIISQERHLARALFIANHYQLKAVGFSAGNQNEDKAFSREFLARLKCTYELLFNK